jgi:excinuclease UvrABC helicase subunit UvrB
MPNKRPLIPEGINFHKKKNLQTMQAFVRQKRLSYAAQIVSTHGSVGINIENLKRLEHLILTSNATRTSPKKAGIYSAYVKHANHTINTLRETIPQRIRFIELCINETRTKSTTDPYFFQRAKRDLEELNLALKEVNDIKVEIDQAESKKMQLNHLINPLKEQLAQAQKIHDFVTARQLRAKITKLEEQ